MSCSAELDTHSIELRECTRRVDVAIEEEEARHRLNGSNGEHCPPPDATQLIARVFRRRCQELLRDNHNGLITRQFLREERLLELTLLRLQDVQLAEDRARHDITTDEALERAPFDLVHAHLELLCAHGTAGTVVGVEEAEREVRFHVLVFEEVAAFEAISELFDAGLEALAVTEARRAELHRRAVASIIDAEWCGRATIAAEEEPGARAAVGAAETDARRILWSLLEWRVVVRECDARLELERTLELLHEAAIERLVAQRVAEAPHEAGGALAEDLNDARAIARDEPRCSDPDEHDPGASQCSASVATSQPSPRREDDEAPGTPLGRCCASSAEPEPRPPGAAEPESQAPPASPLLQPAPPTPRAEYSDEDIVRMWAALDDLRCGTTSP